MPAKYFSSVSPRFHYRRLAFCFLPLAAILESLLMSPCQADTWEYNCPLKLDYGISPGAHQQMNGLRKCGVCNLAIKNKTFSEKWMELKIIMLSEISQNQTHILCFLSCIN
jgi:hypothetical protein